ncbi:MAG TPA: ABC transporter ATP-binding protein [Ensifer sp.]|nr:ABC transporter ATP-binding protein [Ensifer sp.]
MTAETSILEIDGVGVTFADLKALQDVSFDVAPGEKLALLGHNGAGKSTLFKCVLGFLKPAAGRITVAGDAPGSDHARRSVSYLPEQVAFPRMLTGIEIITYFARLKSVDPREALPLLDLVGLSQAGRRRVGDYSKGMRQRLGLAQALIGKPDLLLLDEPTSGLDPVSRREFYEIIDRVAQGGAAVLLSSHALTEVEGHVDRIAILSKGRMVADGTIKALAEAARLPITIRIKAREGQADALSDRFGGKRINGRSVELSCEPAGKVDLVGRLTERREEIDDIDIALPSLDDIYRFYSNRAETGDAA